MIVLCNICDNYLLFFQKYNKKYLPSCKWKYFHVCIKTQWNFEKTAIAVLKLPRLNGHFVSAAKYGFFYNLFFLMLKFPSGRGIWDYERSFCCQFCSLNSFERGIWAKFPSDFFCIYFWFFDFLCPYMSTQSANLLRKIPRRFDIKFIVNSSSAKKLRFFNLKKKGRFWTEFEFDLKEGFRDKFFTIFCFGIGPERSFQGTHENGFSAKWLIIFLVWNRPWKGHSWIQV